MVIQFLGNMSNSESTNTTATVPQGVRMVRITGERWLSSESKKQQSALYLMVVAVISWLRAGQWSVVAENGLLN